MINMKTISEKLSFLKNAVEKRIILQKESKGIEEVDLLIEMTRVTEEVYGSTSNQTINILNELGGAAKYIGKYDLAVESIKRAKDIIEEKFSKDCVPYATTCLNLAEVYRFANELDKIEDMYLEVIRVYDSNNMQESYEYAGVCNNLGLFYQDIKNSDKALSYHLKSYEILKDKKESKIAFATTLNNMAIAYRMLGESEKSDDLIKQCFEIYEKEVGKNHSMYSAALNNLAIAMYYKGEFEKSLELFSNSLEICKNSFGTDSMSYKNLEQNINLVKETMEMGKHE